MLLAILSQFVVMLFKSMTFLVNLLNPMNLLEAIGFKQIGPQLVSDISSSSSTWEFGTNPNTSFVFDSTVSSGGSPGSFKTNGSGIKKRILNKTIQACVPVTSILYRVWFCGAAFQQIIQRMGLV